MLCAVTGMCVSGGVVVCAAYAYYYTLRRSSYQAGSETNATIARLRRELDNTTDRAQPHAIYLKVAPQ